MFSWLKKVAKPGSGVNYNHAENICRQSFLPSFVGFFAYAPEAIHLTKKAFMALIKKGEGTTVNGFSAYILLLFTPFCT